MQNEMTAEALFAARLLRLISEAKEIETMLREAHGRACLEITVTDSQETDLRIVEGEFATARRSLRRLLKVAP
jgi:regulator of extracellular matrix RemA (YlzA/DUF370 family)